MENSISASALIGQAPHFLAAVEKASLLAKVNRPILIQGERGTGKELFAERLHYLSPRWQQPLIKVNCAAFSPSLLDSELFGHEAGAFTDAKQRRLGKFERANGGTLLLDEIATLTFAAQEKLLRLIEYGQFERLGGQKVQQIDVRVIGASHQCLKSAVAQGQFRADLLDRLTFDVVHVPPLKARREDILPLAEHFAVRWLQEQKGNYFGGWSARAEQTLLGHNWPGNVRELKNAVERSLYYHGQDTPVTDVIIDPFQAPWGPTDANPGNDDALDVAFPLDFTLQQAQFSRRLIEQALAFYQYHQKQTAQGLNLSYDQLRGLMKKYAIDRKTQSRR